MLLPRRRGSAGEAHPPTCTRCTSRTHMAHRVILLEQHGSMCRDEQRGRRPMFCLLAIIHLDLTPQILPLPDWDFSVSFRISTPRFWKTRDDVTGSYFNPQFDVWVPEAVRLAAACCQPFEHSEPGILCYWRCCSDRTVQHSSYGLRSRPRV